MIDAVVNKTMLQDAVGVPGLGPSYWSLWAEMRVYLFVALVAWLGLTYKPVVVFAMEWTIGAAIAKTADRKVLKIVAMPKCARYSLVGVGLHLVHRFGHHLITLLLIGSNLAFCLDQAMFRMDYQLAPGPAHSAEPLGGGSCRARRLRLDRAIACGRLRWLNQPWLAAAGAPTYPFHLLHQQVGFDHPLPA